MKRKIELFSILIFIIANLLLLFGKHLGILLSDFAQGSLHLVIELCLGIIIYLNNNITKKAKSILISILVVSAAIAFIIAMGF